MYNNEPSSFCTLGSYPVHKEMIGLLISISIHHPGIKIYCISDLKTKKFIENFLYKVDIKIYWKTLLDKYSHQKYIRVKKSNFQKEFLSYKTNAINFALANEKDTMFLDTDIVVLNKIKGVNFKKKLGLSPHFINAVTAKTYGFFNTGCVWTKDKNFTKIWKKEIKNSNYVDQECMDKISKMYKSNIFYFPDNYNFTWFRSLHAKKNINIKNKIISKKNNILFDGNDIKFVHSHFPQTSNMHWYKKFNQLIIKKLYASSMIYELICIYVMMSKSWFITIGKSNNLNLKNILLKKNFLTLNFFFRKYLIFILFRSLITLTRKLN